jgi:hypothetical protein
VAAALAVRIALRVLPIMVSALDRSELGHASRDRLTLAVFRATAISRSALKYPDREIATATVAADATAAYAATATIWSNIRSDCDLLDDVRYGLPYLAARPLWPEGRPEFFLDAYARATAIWQKERDKWSNWNFWYGWRVEGQPREWPVPPAQDADMARRLIEADADFWQRGEQNPAFVNAKIGEWLAELTPAGGAPDHDIDFFVSFAHADETAASEVADVLEEAGHSTFSMLRDFGPGNFVQKMNEGLARSRHFIPLYSPAYFASEQCEAEWSAAYNRDPSARNAHIRAFELEPAQPWPLARQIVWKRLYGLKGAAERRQAVLDWVNWQPARKSPAEARAIAEQVTSPQPVATPQGTLGTRPNTRYDTPVNQQDLVDPVQDIRLLIAATLPGLGGNVPPLIRHNLGHYHAALEHGWRGAAWGAMDRLIRFAESEFRHAAAETFSRGEREQLEEIFAVHRRTMMALANEDERLRDLLQIEVDETASGQAIARPVAKLKEAAGILSAADLTEDSFDDTFRRLDELGRSEEFPPPPRAGDTPDAISRRKAWVGGRAGHLRRDLQSAGFHRFAVDIAGRAAGRETAGGSDRIADEADPLIAVRPSYPASACPISAMAEFSAKAVERAWPMRSPAVRRRRSPAARAERPLAEASTSSSSPSSSVMRIAQHGAILIWRCEHSASSAMKPRSSTSGRRKWMPNSLKASIAALASCRPCPAMRRNMTSNTRSVRQSGRGRGSRRAANSGCSMRILSISSGTSIAIERRSQL